jgi:Ala-tRNA(Pro) deacylase
VNSEKKLDKKKLKSALPNMKTFRFLTEKELFDLTTLVPGSVPPYGRPILDVEMFLVDSGLEKVSEIGFNCGELTHSVVLERGEFFKSIKPDMIVDLGE